MSFQGLIRVGQASGKPGEEIAEAPKVVTAYSMVAGTAPIIGHAYTHVLGTETVRMGGTGVFAGIAISPKESALLGTPLGSLEATESGRENSIVYLLTEGTVYVIGTSTGAVDDAVYWGTAAGNLLFGAGTNLIEGASLKNEVLIVSDLAVIALTG